MRLDSDFVLIGTGVAPLIAAQQLLQQEKSVMILNPEYDFFGEHSELPLDPLWPWDSAHLSPIQLDQSQFEVVFSELRPEYPGSLESWPKGKEEFTDPSAPFVRSRTRMWMSTSDEKRWSEVEKMYVESLDAGFKPQLLDGLIAKRRFPGMASKKSPPSDRGGGVLFPKMGDVDVERYSNGLREFMRERLGDERMVTRAGPIELLDESVRFRQEGQLKTARVFEGVLVFWTPQLSRWIQNLCKKYEIKPVFPLGVRIWEEWSLVSKEPIDPTIVGAYEDILAWADFEGEPEIGKTNRLKVLCAGDLIPLGESPEGISFQSLQKISKFCHEFLRWGKFTVRSMRTRSLLEWPEEATHFIVFRGAYEARVFNRVEGSLSQVVKVAKQASQRFFERS